MVTVFFRGGLGNQMFQYAAGLSVATKNNADLVLDTVHVSDRFPRKNFTYRTFDLPEVFAIAPRYTRLSRLAGDAQIPGLWLGLDLAAMKFGSALGAQRIFTEKNYRFDPEIFNVKGNVILFGRWQSEKYFSEIESKIRAAFTFKNPLLGEAASVAEKITTSNSVSLHVRRGDYAAFANVTELMGETNIPYYANAAKYVGDRVRDPKFFVFSDDINWCKKNITLPYPVEFVPDSSAGPQAAYHLELMSLAKNNIIANSTFSWWGAWLNRNPQKIVVTPKHWLSDGHGDDADIVPARWIKI